MIFDTSCFSISFMQSKFLSLQKLLAWRHCTSLSLWPMVQNQRKQTKVICKYESCTVIWTHLSRIFRHVMGSSLVTPRLEFFSWRPVEKIPLLVSDQTDRHVNAWLAPFDVSCLLFCWWLVSISVNSVKCLRGFKITPLGSLWPLRTVVKH